MKDPGTMIHEALCSLERSDPALYEFYRTVSRAEKKLADAKGLGFFDTILFNGIPLGATVLNVILNDYAGSDYITEFMKSQSEPYELPKSFVWSYPTFLGKSKDDN